MNAIDLIKRHEGFRDRAYQDTRGIWSIGYGFTFLLQSECDAILNGRILGYEKELELLSWYKNLDGVRRAAILDMRHQLGFNGLLRFKQMIGALVRKDWHRARIEALDSAWAKQTPTRAREIAEMLFSGKWA